MVTEPSRHEMVIGLVRLLCIILVGCASTPAHVPKSAFDMPARESLHVVLTDIVIDADRAFAALEIWNRQGASVDIRRVAVSYRAESGGDIIPDSMCSGGPATHDTHPVVPVRPAERRTILVDFPLYVLERRKENSSTFMFRVYVETPSAAWYGSDLNLATSVMLDHPFRLVAPCQCPHPLPGCVGIRWIETQPNGSFCPPRRVLYTIN